MYQILDGKELARKIREELKLKVDKLKENGIVPKLAVILVGDDSASKVYVKNKSKACKDVGVEFEEILLDEKTPMERLIEIIEKLNNREDINGILLQSPIPKGLNIQEAFEKIHCKKDVDGFNPVNVGKLMIGEDTFISCTPYGIIKMLEAYNIEIEGKHAVVIGTMFVTKKCYCNNMSFENKKYSRNNKNSGYINFGSWKEKYGNCRYGKRWGSCH